jgi:DNA-binding transcriptional regulator YiaG
MKKSLQQIKRRINMPNIAVILKEEISRLARKEMRKQTGVLRKTSAQHRKEIAELKRRISDLQRTVNAVEKQAQKEPASVPPSTGKQHARFSAKGLRSHRKRLGLSAGDYGKLIGVTGQTVYKWENETTRPRAQQIETLAAIRGIGKKELQARLKMLASKKGRKKSKKK